MYGLCYKKQAERTLFKLRKLPSLREHVIGFVILFFVENTPIGYRLRLQIARRALRDRGGARLQQHTPNLVESMRRLPPGEHLQRPGGRTSDPSHPLKVVTLLPPWLVLDTSTRESMYGRSVITPVTLHDPAQPETSFCSTMLPRRPPTHVFASSSRA